MLPRFIFVTFVFILILPVFADDYGHWSAYVPKTGTAKAKVMVLGLPKDIQEISEKIELARETESEFFDTQREKAKPGEPMDYDSRFGVSEGEYSRLLEGAKEVVMQAAGEVDIEFSVNHLGLATLTGLPVDSPHNKLEYDLEQDTMYTPYGDLTTLACT